MEIIEIDIKDFHSLLLQTVLKLFLHFAHGNGVFWRIGADEKRNLIAQAFLLQKTLASYQGQEMVVFFLN
jgi:hypothetical protein